MTEEKTAETNGSRSFEERVFARFDSMDERFDRLETRLTSVESRMEKLEAKQYDTKPIWERALAAIAQTNTEMTAGFDALRAEMMAGDDGLRAEMTAGFDALRAEIATTNTRMDSGFDQIRTNLDFSLRGVERKIDVLNQNILDLRAEQRYVDSRLEKLESPPKPS